MFLEAASRFPGPPPPPGRCLVVEDSWAGVEAGHRAGMVVVQAGRAAPHQGAVELLPSLEMFQPSKYGLPDWGEGETSTEE